MMRAMSLRGQADRPKVGIRGAASLAGRFAQDAILCHANHRRAMAAGGADKPCWLTPHAVRNTCWRTGFSKSVPRRNSGIGIYPTNKGSFFGSLLVRDDGLARL